MNIVLWILQGLLTILFLLSGGIRVVKPKDEIREMGDGRMEWVDDLSAGQLKLIGILEVMAAIGLILPALTCILPILTPLAAVGLVLTMIGAMILHIRRGDPRQVLVMNVVLLLVAGFVAYGRFVLVPFTA